MPPLPYTHAAARIALYALLAVFVAGEQRLRLRSWRDRGGTHLDRGSLLVIVISLGAGIAAAFVLASDAETLAIGGARWELFGLGVALMAAGIAVRQWAVWMLGSAFTVDVRVRAGQAVVDRGPYRWVRHPSYAALLVIMIGLGLVLGNWGSLIALAVLPTIGVVVRINVEERALLDHLGEPYRRFAATRARLLPHVW